VSLFDKLKIGVHQTYVKNVEKIMPTLKESKFLDDGVLTPEEVTREETKQRERKTTKQLLREREREKKKRETSSNARKEKKKKKQIFSQAQPTSLSLSQFVAAGDLLVHKCPTWTWESAEEGKGVSYLPKNKQFLLTRNVPCLMRLSVFEGQVNASSSATVADTDGDWCAPSFDAAANTSTSTSTSTSSSSASASSTATATTASTSAVASSSATSKAPVESDDDDIPDMETFEDENIGEADDAAIVAPAVAAAASSKSTSSGVAAAVAAASSAAASKNDNIVRTRTYDISITYDKYYQTPKLWLFGYDEARQPLKAEQVFEDISADHAQKTVTIETHPGLSSSWAFIHPCRHAAVMKRIIERQLANNSTPRADQYLFLFLKFINAVIPTIEYDSTIEMTA
jgi:ubiquitin-like-conjugating enzyme ATG3